MFRKIIKRLGFLKEREVKRDDWDAEKIKSITPVVKEVLEIINKHDFPFSDKDNWEELSVALRKPTSEILELFLKNNLLINDVSFVRMLVNTQIERIFQSVADSLGHSYDNIETALYGRPMRDLDFKSLDSILRGIDDEVNESNKL